MLSTFGSRPEEEACTRIAETYPDECGPCNSNKCASTMPRLSITELILQNFVLSEFERYVVFGNYTGGLSTPGPHTVMMPWENAFDRMEPSLMEKLKTRPWAAHLSDFLMYHAIEGDFAANELLETQTLATRNQETVTITRQAGTTRIRINGILVIAHYDASNGYAYMLDDVLLPSWVKRSILDLVAHKYQTFFSLVVLAELEAALKEPSLTLFVPSDAAFAGLSEVYLDHLHSSDGRSDLVDLVQLHVAIDGPHPSVFFRGAEGLVMLSTLGPETINIGNGVPTTIISGSSQAIIFAADQAAFNGVVHEINNVLLPN